MIAEVSLILLFHPVSSQFGTCNMTGAFFAADGLVLYRWVR